MSNKTETALINLMAKLAYDPLGFVIAAYPWGQGQLKGFDGPDGWQREMLTDIGELVNKNRFDGVAPVPPLLFKRQSGHGIGKSAMAGWLSNWICSTRPHCKGTISANTEKQVKTKTWTEIRKWFSLSLTSHWFEVKAESIRHRFDKQMEVNVQSSKEENFNSFSGQHAIDSTSFYILDESSTIPDIIWETMMGGLTDGEPMVFSFGNPVLNSGYFYQISKGPQRKYWNIGEIDSRTCKLTNKAELDRQIEEYGADSDFVRVRILGKAPRSDNLQFISEELVEAAANRTLKPDQYYHAPIILGADPAWMGEDPHVLGKRQGLQFVVLGAWRHLPHETVGFTNVVAKAIKEHRSDAEFIDIHGIGGGVYDQLCRFNYDPTPCDSSSSSIAEKQCANNRTQMWWNMRKWLMDGGCIPNDPLLKADLVGPHCYLAETGRHAGKYMLESKKDMKKRGLDSPGRAEVLAYTFFQPVTRRPHNENDIEFDYHYMHGTLKKQEFATDYNPLKYR
jgi:hypothetical protein